MTEKFVAIRGSLTKEQAEEIVAEARHSFTEVSEEKRKRALEIALANLEAMTEEEDREITENALADPDNPPLDDAFFDRWERRLQEEAAADTEEVTLRLDAEVVERLRASGKGWQARANAMLRKAVGLE